MKRSLRPALAVVFLVALCVLLTSASASDNGSSESGASDKSASDKDKSSKTTDLAAVTFTKDVAPILYSKCAECHRPGEAAPFSVLSYKDVRPWARSIKDKVVSHEMPPWHADPHTGVWANDRRLSADQIQKIAAWVDHGAAEGNPADLPTTPTFPDGWSIGKPDVVFQIQEETTLDATGPDEYQYFDVPTNFTEDKYVQMAEARPGNRKIVHHIIAFTVPGGSPSLSNMNKEQRNIAVNMSLMGTPFYRDGLLIRMKADEPVSQIDEKDWLPGIGHSLAARQIYAAACQSWVFGGMGSWNDLVFQDPIENSEYEDLSRQLYEAINSGIELSVNSFRAP